MLIYDLYMTIIKDCGFDLWKKKIVDSVKNILYLWANTIFLYHNKKSIIIIIYYII